MMKGKILTIIAVLSVLIICGVAIVLIAIGDHEDTTTQELHNDEQVFSSLELDRLSEKEIPADDIIEDPIQAAPSDTVKPAEPGLPPPQTEHKQEIIVDDPATELKNAVLNGCYGQMPIEELLDLTLRTRDPSRVEMRLALLLRKEESLPLIKQQLRESNDENYLYELLMLTQGQLRWSEFTPEILGLLNDISLPERVRGRAATASALFQAKEAIPAIRKLLQTAEDLQVRQLAAMALGRLKDTDSRYLLEDLLYDDSPYGRVTAAAVLGRLDSNVGEQTALELSYDQNFGMRSRAAQALSLIDTPDAKKRLEEIRTEDPSINVRYETNEYMGRTELDRLTKSEAIVRLEDLLTQEHPPRWAFVYLAQNFGYDSVELLEDLAKKPGPLSYAAAVAILEIESEVVMRPR